MMTLKEEGDSVSGQKSQEGEADYIRRRERWDALQGAKIRAALKAQQQLDAREDAQRHRDNQREPPLDWVPEATAFGSGASEALRRALQ